MAVSPDGDARAAALGPLLTARAAPIDGGEAHVVSVIGRLTEGRCVPQCIAVDAATASRVAEALVGECGLGFCMHTAAARGHV